MAVLVRVGSFVLAALLAGCTGRPVPSGEPAPPAPAAPATCSAGRPPAGKLRHLTRAEYENTVRDLLGIAVPGTLAFPQDLHQDGFAVGAGISPLLMQSYLDAAEAIADQARPRVRSLAPCKGGDSACAQAFVQRFGLRAYRRPLTGDEADRLMAVYRAGADEGDGHEAGITAVIQAALSAPQFYYRLEQDPEGAGAGQNLTLVGYELASRLSYFLWQSMPDDDLFEAAARGELNTPEQITEQARRMLSEQRARDGLWGFFAQWTDTTELTTLAKDQALFPFVQPGSGPALQTSLRAFIEDALWTGDGTLDSLFRSRAGFVTPETAPFFGVAADGPARVDLPEGERAGLLTQPAWLAAHAKTNQSDPIARGKFVRERLLCQPLPPPPPNVNTTVPDPQPHESTRERFSRHTSDPACSACHQLIDPLGFAFESYDAVGRFRREDGGRPVDARGRLSGTGDAEVSFDGAPELADRLLQTPRFRACLSEQILRFAVGELTGADVSCDVARISARPRLLDMFIEATVSAAFTSRRVTE